LSSVVPVDWPQTTVPEMGDGLADALGESEAEGDSDALGD